MTLEIGKHKTPGALYAKRWRNKNKEEVKAQKRKWYLKYKDKHLARLAKAYVELRREVFTAYGGFVCACDKCPEINPSFMTIDHIGGCSRELRKLQGLGGRMYRWLQLNGYPPGYRVLCYNCNQGRAKNKGICPHEGSHNG